MSRITPKPSRKGFSGVKSKFNLFLLGLMLFFLFSFPSVSASDGFSSAPVKLNVFIVIGVFAFLLLVIGLGANIPFFNIVGFFLIAVLGWIIFNGSLLVPSGETMFIYGDNYDSYHYDDYGVSASPSVSDLNVFHEVKEFEAWDSGNYRFIGFFIMMIGIFATFFSVFAVFGGGSD